MSYYRRLHIPGAIYFFTVVTFGRMPILTKPAVRRILRAAYGQTCNERPFETIAIVLLPDHLHCLWQLPDGDSDFSTRWKLIKGRFTSALPETGIALPPPSPSRAKRGEQTAWHRRFWEHLVRDENDLKRHADYIHYNPVKHGYAKRPADWPFSTFHKWVAKGEYSPGWGASEPEALQGWEPQGE